MNVDRFDGYEQMSNRAATIVLNEIGKKNDLLICGTTGNSPTLNYHP